MQLMKPIASEEIPVGTDWVYEVKYDGFRCVLEWTESSIKLISRNDKDLTANFPEIIAYCREIEELVSEDLPLLLDGELVVLNNPYQANFSWIQKRGRLKHKEPIAIAADQRPASFMAFDLLSHKGGSMTGKPFTKRKNTLLRLLRKAEQYIQLVPFYEDSKELWTKLFLYKGEGIVAKRKSSQYGDAKKHRDWYKIKNWRTVEGFLTFYDPENSYFTVSIYDQGEVRQLGKSKHGLESDEFSALKDLFTINGEKVSSGYRLPPAVCAQIHTLDLYKNELREPEFHQLLPQKNPAECTAGKLALDISMLPEAVEPTNTDKIFWPQADVTKGDLLVYMREIAPYMLPFLKGRRLTLIRCPDGVEKESFFQKHLPDYAPDFINGIKDGGEEFFIADSLDSLIWFANHGAIEYHIPFQTVDTENPTEIVFDLDPPDRSAFPLAIHAAELLKQMLDDLELVSFVKTSGGKGLQVHIPIPCDSMTYEQTGVFTEAIAKTLAGEYPDQFTVERMKRNRHGRLYIDYVQHAKDKTLVAAYSPRKSEDATVAAPLFWEEVKHGLTPASYTVTNMVARVQSDGCPFADYFKARKKQTMEKVLNLVKQ
ncbi:DNA ligase D [Virgibacillus kekensis]|uniref:DNA ligase (ATP) n=1 Tax=Virgibacillus kekensis TaxID=202261 RepID=A0ABV9DK46_9BACI